jgi:organic anion transporter 4A
MYTHTCLHLCTYIGYYIVNVVCFSTADGGGQNECHLGSNSSIVCDVNESPASLSNYRYVFFLGQLLHGAGAAPLSTLGVTYLDENLPLRSSSFYIGNVFIVSIFL